MEVKDLEQKNLKTGYLALEGSESAAMVLEMRNIIRSIQSITAPDSGKIDKMVETISELTSSINTYATNIASSANEIKKKDQQDNELYQSIASLKEAIEVLAQEQKNTTVVINKMNKEKDGGSNSSSNSSSSTSYLSIILTAIASSILTFALIKFLY